MLFFERHCQIEYTWNVLDQKTPPDLFLLRAAEVFLNNELEDKGRRDVGCSMGLTTYCDAFRIRVAARKSTFHQTAEPHAASHQTTGESPGTGAAAGKSIQRTGSDIGS